MNVRVEELIDWKNPDYAAIFRERARRFAWLRANPDKVPALRGWYREHVADFISEWGVTIDPRNVAKNRPAYLPFVLLPKQRELVDWIVERWRKNESGIVEKSRDVGASWVAMAVAVSICLLHENVMVGVGSAKEDKLDRTGDPDTLFYKARTFIENLPAEFRGGWNAGQHSMYMRLQFLATGSSITGEAGNNIGRGGRKSFFILDESAHIEHPDAVDASLIATTDCRIDISSVNGMANSFALRRHSGKFPVFTFHYRDDLRKTQEWIDAKRLASDPVIWASEYDLNYTASVEGVIIPQELVQAAVDAHTKLGISASGPRRGSFDVGDTGDRCAFAARHGALVTHCESWSGVGSDIFKSTERCFMRCDEWNLDGFDYDADGLGASVRGDANQIRERRAVARRRALRIGTFHGSGAVFDPERKVPGTDLLAQDMFQNLKAQSWYLLRQRFLNTFRAITGQPYDKGYMVFLSSEMPELSKLTIELSQPQWKISGTGKRVVDKTPEGAHSPNLADALMMLFAPQRLALVIDPRIFEE